MKNLIQRISGLTLLVITCLFLAGCTSAAERDIGTGQEQSTGTLEVHFLDVGQADSTLFVVDGHALLVDAGNNDDEEFLLSYLKGLGISRLDYVIGTHPHEDHIGSLDSIILNFDVDTVIMPPKTHTSRTFTDVMDALETKDLSITLPQQNDTYSLGSASFTILSADKDYGDNLNNWSVGIRLTYGDHSFVLCGDMEAAAELDVLDSGLLKPSDVLKVNHHGSHTSSTPEFLAAVAPEYAVILVGTGNDYGHPAKQTMERLSQAGIQVFRTDLQGTIIAKSDGTTLSFSTGALPAAPAKEQSAPEQANLSEYVLNTNTHRFHLPSCSSVSQMKESSKELSQKSREELLEEGYEPCKNCNP